MILNKNNSNTFYAVSFETATFTDLHFYMQDLGVELRRVDPNQFITSIPDSLANYINLVVQDITLRKKISKIFDTAGINRFSFVHKNAIIDGAEIGPGTFVYPLTIAYRSALIGKDNIVHSLSLIAHGSKTGDGCYMSAGVIVGGSTSIGDYCVFGIGVTVYDKVNIVSHCNFGARAIIRKNITDSSSYGFGQNNKLIKMVIR